jgi:hypothetical protein
MIIFTRQRMRIGIILLILVPLGFYSKFYSGPASHWVHDYAGDILYPIFWFYVLIFILPKIKPGVAAVSVFLFSTAIEFTQLLNTACLEHIRSTFLGRALIGTGFVPMDIAYYLVGCVLAIVLHSSVVKRQ